MATDLPTPTIPPPLAGLGREAGQGWGEGSVVPVAPILLGATLLLWPAAINGYPLVFSDTGTYLSQAINHYLGWDRPAFYSLFMLPLHLTLTTWPVIVVQALLAAHTLHLLRRALLPALSVWWLVPLLGTLSAASALPWLASQLMPDLFTGLLVLALGLLLFARASLSRREQLWLTGLAAFMIATHQSHLPLILLLIPALLPLRWWLGRGPRTGTGRDAGSNTGPGTQPAAWPDRWRSTCRDAGRLLTAALLACGAMVGLNLIGHHRASLAPFGNVFVLARVIYDGPGMAVLARDCPHTHWRLCPYLSRFPANADLFLWQQDGPVARAGGAKLVSTEADSIVADALAAEPMTELRAVLANAARQLALFATGDGLTPWPWTVTPWILQDFPRFEADAYLASRQANGLPLLPAWLGMVHRVVALLGVAICAALLPVALFRRHRVAGFLALVLLVLPINALIAGGLSGPHDRYQSRVMWLPSLLAALAIPALAIPGLAARRPAVQVSAPDKVAGPRLAAPGPVAPGLAAPGLAAPGLVAPRLAAQRPAVPALAITRPPRRAAA
jgi:hypothetical protein